MASVWICCHATFKLITLPDAIKTGARCLDGSAPAYYFEPASKSEDADKWVLYIQGGGWCYKDEACLTRSKTNLGSSNEMSKSTAGHGIFSSDANENPEFHSWNHVVLAYCDGASFSGMRRDAVSVGGKKIYYRGYYNLKAIINALLKDHGMNKATQVILTGGSAGGAATFIHADQIASMLPNTVKRYKAAPLSGMFMHHVNVNGEHVYDTQLKHVFEMQNCTYGVDTHCLVGRPDNEKYLCMFGQEAIKTLMTPMFVFNSFYDEWSLRCIMTAEPVKPESPDNYNCSAAPGWSKCVKEESCTKEQWKELNTKWGDDYRTMIKDNKGLKARGNGLFAYSCHLHDAEIKEHHWTNLKIGKTSMRDAFINWYKSNNEEADKHTYTDCTIDGNFHCNPTCKS